MRKVHFALSGLAGLLLAAPALGQRPSPLPQPEPVASAAERADPARRKPPRAAPQARDAGTTGSLPDTADLDQEFTEGWYAGLGTVRGTREAVANLARPLEPRFGGSERLVEACRETMRSAASPYRIARIEAVSAGAPQALPQGGVEAPVEVRILYQRPAGYEVVQATLTCRTDAAGTVVDVKG